MELKNAISQAKQIWEAIFGDSREFIEKYFEYVGEENIIYLENKDRLFGFCLIPSYKLSIFNDIIQADYISGLCVADDERRKGNGKTIIENAIKHSFESGHQVIFLVAQDNEMMQYYQQFGFGNCSINDRRVFKLKDVNEVFLDTHTLNFDYITFLKNYDCGDIQSGKFILHERKTLDLYHDSGYLFANVIDDEDEGFSPGAIFVEEDDYLNVIELNVKNRLQKTIILSLLADRYEKDVHYKEPMKEYNSEGIYMDIFNKSKRDIYQMMRIVDVDTCLSIFAANHPFVDTILKIEDNLIAENNKTVWIKNGELIIFDDPYDVPGQREIKDMTVKRLTTLCLSNIYLTLLFDE
ncbi:MAG: GNAT family N-acetyltransferase [Bacteroidales bacterium]|jgi:ribosomal protein S18 acetylase RimI-like enzyme|nr:GNAT family N-acetyltransferase [Bacteroidales bacterium]